MYTYTRYTRYAGAVLGVSLSLNIFPQKEPQTQQKTKEHQQQMNETIDHDHLPEVSHQKVLHFLLCS